MSHGPWAAARSCSPQPTGQIKHSTRPLRSLISLLAPTYNTILPHRHRRYLSTAFHVPHSSHPNTQHPFHGKLRPSHRLAIYPSCRCPAYKFLPQGILGTSVSMPIADLQEPEEELFAHPETLSRRLCCTIATHGQAGGQKYNWHAQMYAPSSAQMGPHHTM